MTWSNASADGVEIPLGRATGAATIPGSAPSMARRGVYWVGYRGEMNDDDRVMLDRPGFKLDENGYGVTAAFQGDETPDTEPAMFQVVRVTASGPADARQRVIEALGREPDDLRAWRA